MQYWSCMQDCMALLAYEEPETSPMFHYLQDEYRQSVADGLNRAVLGTQSSPKSQILSWISETLVLSWVIFASLGLLFLLKTFHILVCTFQRYCEVIAHEWYSTLCLYQNYSTCQSTGLYINGEVATAYYCCKTKTSSRTWQGDFTHFDQMQYSDGIGNVLSRIITFALVCLRRDSLYI